MYENEVRLFGKVVKIHPIKQFTDAECMLIAELKTSDADGEYTHRVSMRNEKAIEFKNKISCGDIVRVNAKLCPRPMDRNNPNGATFFEIRVLEFASAVIMKPLVNADPFVVNDSTAHNLNLSVENNQPQRDNIVKFQSEVKREYPPKNELPQEQPQENQTDVGSSHPTDDNLDFHDEIEFLNGAPVDRSLPFYPVNGRNK